jgi:RHS repeat-associated protein
VARVDSAGAVHYYFSDHLGSHGVVENATATVCEQDIDYYPYGGVQNDYCPSVGQNYKLTGKERDSESGLDYFGARYNASPMGRFMTPDWAAEPVAVPYAVLPDPQTLNLYGYARNNPASKHDPDGHVAGVDDATILLVGGGIIFTAAVIHYYSQNPDANPGVAFGAAAHSTLQAIHNFFRSDNSKTVPSPQSNPAPGTQTAGVTAAPAVPLPSGLVGTQDDKSGQSGGRIVNGPLDPAHGGVGDAGKDFDTLTGGKSGPAPTGSTLPAGSQVGDNGIVLRPGQDGPRIDIPANGDKPRETLHYPQQQEQEQDQEQQ